MDWKVYLKNLAFVLLFFSIIALWIAGAVALSFYVHWAVGLFYGTVFFAAMIAYAITATDR